MSIVVSKDIQLRLLSPEDHAALFELMSEIYPPAYSHFWEDGGEWYINSQYSIDNFKEELLQENQAYYFVLFQDEVVGIVRLLFDEVLPVQSDKKAVKLHRIYLHQKTQGKGVGKQLLNYIEQLAKAEDYAIFWLEVMEKQPQAFHFYEKLGFKIVDKYTYEKDLLFKQYRPMFAVCKEF